MKFAERSPAIEALGFTARQAMFLTIVALQSGYCLRRQYATSACLKDGKNAREFLDKLVERKVADRVGFRAGRSGVYHVFGRRLYAAIGYEHSKNRVHATPATIAQKLMLLDFTLAHPELDWYPTQTDKIDLFATRLGVPSGGVTVPRLPVFLHGASPCVNFVCLVTDPPGSAIGAFIRQHAPLLRNLTDWTLNVLIPERVSNDQACEAAYGRAIGAVSMSLASTSKEDLEWFAKTRPLVASGDLRTLDIADLHRYRTLASSLDQRLETRFVKPLVVHHLPHSYTQFGFFAGLA